MDRETAQQVVASMLLGEDYSDMSTVDLMDLTTEVGKINLTFDDGSKVTVRLEVD